MSADHSITFEALVQLQRVTLVVFEAPLPQPLKAVFGSNAQKKKISS